MDNCFKCQLGGLNSQRFAERINSAINVVITKDRLKMDPKLVDVLVTPRMNSKFMKSIRENEYHGSTNIIARMADQINGSGDIWYSIMYHLHVNCYTYTYSCFVAF